MDTLTLRILIIVTGLLVMAAMVAWSWYKNRLSGQNDLDAIDPSLALHPEHDDYEVTPVGGSAPEAGDAALPDLIQLNLAAPENEWFHGPDLVSAFDRLGLTYNEMRIYERQSPDGGVDFRLASLVKPGTFPDDPGQLVDFYCPGLVLFMQPKEIFDPAAAFEDMISVLDLLAIDLGGEKWDHSHQPLTLEVLQGWRERLA